MTLPLTEQGTIPQTSSKRTWVRARDLSTTFRGFMLSREVQNCTPATLQTYERRLIAFFQFLCKHECGDLKDITRTHIELYLRDFQLRNCSPFYVDAQYRSIKAYLRWCLAEQYITTDPLRNVHAPKLPRLCKPFLTPEQFQSLQALCPSTCYWGARNAAILCLLWSTGIRVHEAANIQLKDIEWGSAKRKSSILIYGKGQKERHVPLLPKTKQALWRYLNFRSDDLPQLWLTEEGKPATKWMISSVLHKLEERAGLKLKDRCHIFRRSWAWEQIRAGVPEKYILLVGGWESRAMLDRYIGAATSENAMQANWKE